MTVQYSDGGVTFSFDPKQLERIRTMLGKISPAKRNNVSWKGLVAVGAEAEKDLKYNLTNRILHVRTGNLRRSIGFKAEENNLRIVIGSGVRTGARMSYANIHETGGVILPKKGKFLWIPVRAGSQYAIDKGMWNNRMGKPKKAISFSSKVLRWIPVKMVKIPARRYMSISAAQTGGKAGDIMINVINKAIERQK